MPAITAAGLLDAWESGWDRNPLERGLALLAVDGTRTVDQLRGLRIGTRDRDLFALRAVLFGRWLDGVSRCPACGVEVEIGIDQDDLLTAATADGADADGAVTVGGHRLRLPTSADLAAVLDEIDPRRAAVALIRRCSLDDGRDLPVGRAGEVDVDTVVAAWSNADPAADIVLNLACPACAQLWPEPFDIVSYLWAELDAWCRRTLLDVHDLAAAYGWSEEAALALTPWRRQCYLNLVRS